MLLGGENSERPVASVEQWPPVFGLSFGPASTRAVCHSYQQWKLAWPARIAGNFGAKFLLQDMVTKCIKQLLEATGEGEENFFLV